MLEDQRVLLSIRHKVREKLLKKVSYHIYHYAWQEIYIGGMNQLGWIESHIWEKAHEHVWS